MIKIKKIKYISIEAKEAEILISDGKYELICFSQPYDEDIDKKIEVLNCYNNQFVMRADTMECLIEKLIEPFAYRIIGKVINSNKNIVKIGEILLQLEEYAIPKDIKENEYISFYVQRIDIY